MNVIFGIDPGFTGAASVLHDGQASDVWDIPIVGEGTDKRLDTRQLWADLDGWRASDEGLLWHASVAIEKAQPMPKQGVASAFRYGALYGALRAVCEDLDFRIELIHPGKWKKALGLTGKGKEAARELAMRLFPNMRSSLSRKRDHNRAEALLIAEYLRQQSQG